MKQRSYRRTYHMREGFPVYLNEEWTVMQGHRAAERWRVVEVQKFQFTVEILEYFPK